MDLLVARPHLSTRTETADFCASIKKVNQYRVSRTSSKSVQRFQNFLKPFLVPKRDSEAKG